MSSSGGEHSNRIDEFLLHEFDHNAAALLLSEETGEKRVQFFFTVVTAVFGIVGLAFRSETTPLTEQLMVSWVPVSLGLLLLLILGLWTSLRIVGRNVATDRYTFALRSIRRRFVTDAFSREPPNMFHKVYGEIAERKPISGKGGWFEALLVLNAALVGLLVWVVTNGLQPTIKYVDVLIPAGFALLTACGQFAYARGKYTSNWRTLRDNEAHEIDATPQHGPATPVKNA